jgi:hypothetical protein
MSKEITTVTISKDLRNDIMKIKFTTNAKSADEVISEAIRFLESKKMEVKNEGTNNKNN